ncbi:uncharacterized protein RCC_00930 [Ramularia collo-cygni]|uniref:RING-type domain-containing protein n=1 Tax=Ramularia collo-cygni TaxID=112498 RepID=A0A2D3UT95_9PEZI|nr:uncharacterized protein RCC_00930 [Ramularia collo-cygni]CZT15017.1 uncharacterized protein RCC_00930 [Ramularia collo-cygni]
MVLTRSKSGKIQECACCCESKKADEFAPKPPTEACEHGVTTCLDCLRHWWTASINNHYWPVFSCPDCSEKLVGSKEYLNNNMLEKDSDRYDYLHERIRNGANPDYKFCLQSGCNSGQIYHESDLLVCKSCNSASQEDYQQTTAERRMENEQSEEYIEKAKVEGRIVACPNCACPIETYGRAMRAKCTRCIHSFLWDCGIGVAGWEMDGVVGGGGAESVGEAGDSRMKRVMFPEDEASHRLIRPMSTELGPEVAGKGPSRA